MLSLLRLVTAPRLRALERAEAEAHAYRAAYELVIDALAVAMTRSDPPKRRAEIEAAKARIRATVAAADAAEARAAEACRGEPA